MFIFFLSNDLNNMESTIKKKVLIIEKDTATINQLSRLLVALRLEPIVLYNWSSVSRLPMKDEIIAVFVAVEIQNINVREIVDEFRNEANPQLEPPVFYLYLSEFSEMYKKAVRIPHRGELKKLIRLDDLYNMLSQNIDLAAIPYDELTSSEILPRYESYHSSLQEWLNRLAEMLK